MHDIVVVGAGPVGLYAAKLLEGKLDVAVVEKEKSIGNKACSGLYSTNIEKFVPMIGRWVEHSVKGAIIHSHSYKISVGKKGTAAYVVDRPGFTKHLAKQLKSKVIMNSPVKSIERTSKGFRIRAGKAVFECRLILGCDGANSAVARFFKANPKERVAGLIAKTNEKSKAGFVELWYDKELTKDGFFWKIPRGSSTEYGCLGKDVNFKKLEGFFSLKRYKKESAPIPTGPSKTYFPGCLLLGDAAGITKPWSFGGIVYGFTCAEIAKSVVLKAFQKKDFSEDFLKTYEDKWQEKLGKNITLGLMFREFYKEMDNKQVDKIFEKLQKAEPGRFDKMDMDFPLLGLM